MRVEGKAVLVTGGSRGLGAALGEALASRGARVVLLAREAEPVGAVAAAIRATGGQAHGLSADLGDAAATARVAGVAAALVGPLDLLVHNASELGPLPLRPLLDTTAEDLQRVLAVNLLAPFRLSRALVGSMLVRGEGLVVHVSSDAATSAYPGWGAYGVSKAALDHLARIWAAELEGTGVRFLSVDPGEMNTRMHAQALPEADPATLRDPAQVAEALMALIAEAETLPSGTRVEAAAWLRPAAVSS